jgi:hypothetical protein
VAVGSGATVGRATVGAKVGGATIGTALEVTSRMRDKFDPRVSSKERVTFETGRAGAWPKMSECGASRAPNARAMAMPITRA